MPPSPSAIATDIVASPRRASEREMDRPRRRSWLYRFFIAPFTDIDERAAYASSRKRL